MNKIETKKVAALLLSAAVEKKPVISDWYEQDEDDSGPDLMLGTTNDFWLRTGERGLYLQAREWKLNNFHAVSRAYRFLGITHALTEVLGIVVQLPWPDSEISESYSVELQKEKDAHIRWQQSRQQQ